MDHAAETYALDVPGGVVTYNLCGIFDDMFRRVGSFPSDGRLHLEGSNRSTPLGRASVERYIELHGAGQRLQASL